MYIGDKIPNVQFKSTSGLNANLHDFHGKWLVLYFYPKDATPGCTLEGQHFRDHAKEFLMYHAVILGVSRDSLASHEKFKIKQQFSFELISDPDETLCQCFDVIKSKTLYGKQVRGIERSTFLIDPTGTVMQVWRKVQVKDHVADVLDQLRLMIG